MTTLGQLCLLAAFVGSGYATFACLAGWLGDHRKLRRTGLAGAVASFIALTSVAALLIWALLAKDFRFAYVAQYCSRLLPWHYALSAFWVGQAGSLLLWAWLLAVVALAFRLWPGREPSPLREPAFGVLMAYLCFLVALMVFGADPMEPTLAVPRDGEGLGPSLQHPAMLLHPPVVFLGYACWGIPFALAVAALMSGGGLSQFSRDHALHGARNGTVPLGTLLSDAGWLRPARSWALFAWVVLGVGILLGADWAYEELGWGGYWAWDPVENGSLLPWLTGTALIHTLIAWQHRRVLKKTAVLLTIATFGLCNFAAFLTRSGIFSSLHAFSQSPIGWMFLVLMIGLAGGSIALVVYRRQRLASEQPLAGVFARESLVVISTLALLLLATVTLLGTLAVPLSDIVLGRKITVGTALYNQVLLPIGLLLLATTAAAPLLRWGASPTPAQKRALLLSGVAGGAVAGVALTLGLRHPIALAVAGLAGAAVTALAGAVVLDAWPRQPGRPWRGLLHSLRARRRTYAGFLSHLGFVCLAVGVTGSSLGTCRLDTDMTEGETIAWAGRSIRFVRLIQRDLPGKFVVEAQLEVSRDGATPCTLLPAQHLHLLQNEWTTEVAIHATWVGDFYTILHSGRGQGRVSLTLIENPLMRWIWAAGWLAGIGALVGLWPARRRAGRDAAAHTAGPASATLHRHHPRTLVGHR